MNINRRAEFADGGIWLGRAPGKPCDHELDVVKFEDFNNHTLAVLINWPCHATTSGPDVEIRLTAFRIGHLMLAGISGEVMNEIGADIKKQSPYTSTIIITHCNGSSGYICTDKAFSEGGYEVKVTRLMPGAEKPLTTQVLQMIHGF